VFQCFVVDLAKVTKFHLPGTAFDSSDSPKIDMLGEGAIKVVEKNF
jgi:hypothetical protein